MCIIINHTVKDRGKSLKESFKIYLLSYSDFYNMHQPATVFLVSLVFVLINSRRKHCFFSFSVFLQFIPSQFLLFLEKKHFYVQKLIHLFILPCICSSNLGQISTWRVFQSVSLSTLSLLSVSRCKTKECWWSNQHCMKQCRDSTVHHNCTDNKLFR